MEDAKAQIQKLTGLFKDRALKETLLNIRQELRKADVAHRTKIEAVEDSISEVKRKNKQMEAEVERLLLQQSRNGSGFTKKNSERIQLSRRIIELEQENEEMEIRTRELTGQIVRAEDEVRMLSYPTADELYYEIVKGFGVEFVEMDGQVSAKIMNKSKNDIFTVECVDNAGIGEICEKIWGFIEF